MVFSEDSQLPNREAYVEVEEDLITSSVTYPSHNRELISTFARYLGSESYLDVTFICANSQTIKAHKLVLASVSTFLKEIFENWEGSQSDIFISLPDISRRTMKLVLDFFYVGYISLELDETMEFRNALSVLKIQMQDAVISRTSANPLVRPPKLMILDSKKKRELKKNRLPKHVESVSLSSMYVSNTINAEEEEPIIDMNEAVEPGVSSKVSSVDPENDPLNVPDFYYVQQSAPVEQQKKAINEDSPTTPATGPDSPKESSDTKENTTTNTHTPAVQQKLSKKKSKTHPNNPKSQSDKKKKTPPDPEKPPAKKKDPPNPDKPNQKAKSLHNAEKTHLKVKNPPDTAKHSRSRTTSHSTRSQHGDKLPVSITPLATVDPVPAATDIEASKPKTTEDQDDDPIGWLYKLKKEDLIEQLQQFDLDTSGSLSVLRSRLTHYLQHELQTSEDAPAQPPPTPPLSSSTLNHSLEPKSIDKVEKKGAIASTPDHSAKMSSLKRKVSSNDITIGLKQPRLVIRDMKNEVNLLGRMKVSSLSNLYQPASGMIDTGESGSGASRQSTSDPTKMLLMSPNQNNKLTKKPKDPNLRKSLTDNPKLNPKTQSRRKAPVVPTSSSV